MPVLKLFLIANDIITSINELIKAEPRLEKGWRKYLKDFSKREAEYEKIQGIFKSTITNKTWVELEDLRIISQSFRAQLVDSPIFIKFLQYKFDEDFRLRRKGIDTFLSFTNIEDKIINEISKTEEENNSNKSNFENKIDKNDEEIKFITEKGRELDILLSQ